MRTVVDKMPENPELCQYSIVPKVKVYPCICKLRQKKASDYDIDFSWHNYSNCQMYDSEYCKGECTELITLKDMFKDMLK